MKQNRRLFIKNTTMAGAALAIPKLGDFNLSHNQTGISVASYWLRFRPNDTKDHPTFKNAFDMASHCQTLGAGGAQVGVKNWDEGIIKRLKDLSEKNNFWLEGQVNLPKTTNELAGFENDIKAAKAAGINIVRTACLSGRRYSTFQSLEEWQDFKKASLKSIRLAEPIMRTHKVKLAIENHKDWTADELVEIFKTYDSEWIGCNLDTGNNLSFLENPYEVVEKLAPYTMTTHFKDMGIEDYQDGFLLSEVPFGEGFLNLQRMIYTLKKYNSEVKFNLEMMTRDPLEIPYLTGKYWTTFPDRRPADIVKNIKLIKENRADFKLQRTTGKPFHEQLAMEEENQKACLKFAKEKLGIA